MAHPRFYLPAVIAKAIGLTSCRTSVGGRIEASRGRGSYSQRYSVICDPRSAELIIERIQTAAFAARERSFREQCAVAIMVIEQAIEDAEAPRSILPTMAPSDRGRGLLGL